MSECTYLSLPSNELLNKRQHFISSRYDEKRQWLVFLMYELKTKISVEKHSPQFLFICMQISDDVVDENQTK